MTTVNLKSPSVSPSLLTLDQGSRQDWVATGHGWNRPSWRCLAPERAWSEWHCSPSPWRRPDGSPTRWRVPEAWWWQSAPADSPWKSARCCPQIALGPPGRSPCHQPCWWTCWKTNDNFTWKLCQFCSHLYWLISQPVLMQYNFCSKGNEALKELINVLEEMRQCRNWSSNV